jgi:carbon starvation protein
VFSQLFGGQAMMAFWYHFAILFEALFILTAVDAGTRAGRFMLQDLMGVFVPSLRRTSHLGGNLVATAVCVGLWGFFVYQGVVDPFGGINTLWPLFGIANQMLAGVALMLVTVVLFRMKRQQYAWVSIVPTIWLLICTLTAGAEKVFSSSPAIGFNALADKFAAAVARGEVLAPAKNMDQMQQVIMNNRIDAGLTLLFMGVVISVLIFGIIACRSALQNPQPSTREVTGGAKATA